MSIKIYALIPQIMKELGHIGKNKTNTHQNYQFRGIEDMYNNIHPVLVKHGVFCVPQVIDSTTETFVNNTGKTSFRVMLRVNHKFYADDGSCVEVITAGEGIDTSDKATNKAMSACMKYAFIELLSIPTSDIEDSDRDHETIGSDQAPKYNAPANQPGPAKPNGFGPRNFAKPQ